MRWLSSAGWDGEIEHHAKISSTIQVCILDRLMDLPWSLVFSRLLYRRRRGKGRMEGRGWESDGRTSVPFSHPQRGSLSSLHVGWTLPCPWAAAVLVSKTCLLLWAPRFLLLSAPPYQVLEDLAFGSLLTLKLFTEELRHIHRKVKMTTISLTSYPPLADVYSKRWPQKYLWPLTPFHSQPPSPFSFVGLHE